MKLNNKVVLITGGSSGIGKATAIAFAKEGCTVIINYKSDTKSAESVLEACNKYSKGNSIAKADIADEESVKDMFTSIKKRFSHIDILINNAGIFDENDSPTNVEAFQNVFRNNF